MFGLRSKRFILFGAPSAAMLAAFCAKGEGPWNGVRGARTRKRLNERVRLHATQYPKFGYDSGWHPCSYEECEGRPHSDRVGAGRRFAGHRGNLYGYVRSLTVALGNAAA